MRRQAALPTKKAAFPHQIPNHQRGECADRLHCLRKKLRFRTRFRTIGVGSAPTSCTARETCRFPHQIPNHRCGERADRLHCPRDVPFSAPDSEPSRWGARRHAALLSGKAPYSAPYPDTNRPILQSTQPNIARSGRRWRGPKPGGFFNAIVCRQRCRPIAPASGAAEAERWAAQVQPPLIEGCSYTEPVTMCYNLVRLRIHCYRRIAA